LGFELKESADEVDKGRRKRGSRVELDRVDIALSCSVAKVGGSHHQVIIV